MAEQAAEPVHPSMLLGISGVHAEKDAVRVLDTLEALGLILPGETADGPPMLLRAGEQYLARHGQVEDDILHFLPRAIDDLTAREALIDACTSVVTAFRDAVISGEAVEFARKRIVPPAFRPAVDDAVAIEMFAAAVALVARLASGRPAGCLAEEIVAVALVTHAEGLIEGWEQFEDLDSGDAEEARSAVGDLFEFFQDADVYLLFQMIEPADAALLDDSEMSAGLGMADQRMLFWFEPFSGVPRTGHLRYPLDAPEPPPADAPGDVR